MKNLQTAMCLGLILAIFIGSFSGFAQKLENLQHDVLRLHILANSDSDYDQALKLKVRDRLLEESENLFQGCETLEDMKKRAAEQTDTIRMIAKSVLEENGCQEDVSVQLVQMKFDTRQYDELTMPAGCYEALRILIGKAEGHNWWCVMYPPLCLPVAEPEIYFDTDTAEILENPQKYEVKLKCVEIWDDLKNKLSSDEVSESETASQDHNP